MNAILEKIMELGAAEDRACSEAERTLVINEAEELYNKHLAELNLLNIPVVIPRFSAEKVEEAYRDGWEDRHIGTDTFHISNYS